MMKIHNIVVKQPGRGGGVTLSLKWNASTESLLSAIRHALRQYFYIMEILRVERVKSTDRGIVCICSKLGRRKPTKFYVYFPVEVGYWATRYLGDMLYGVSYKI